MIGMLWSYYPARMSYWARNDSGTCLMPMTRLQAKRILDDVPTNVSNKDDHFASLVARKLKIHSVRSHCLLCDIINLSFLTQNALRVATLCTHSPSSYSDRPLTPLEKPQQSIQPNPDVLDALYSIRTTPYTNSFLSRINGFQPPTNPGVVDVDWETRAPWMNLVQDIRDHYIFMQYVTSFLLKGSILKATYVVPIENILWKSKLLLNTLLFVSIITQPFTTSWEDYSGMVLKVKPLDLFSLNTY